MVVSSFIIGISKEIENNNPQKIWQYLKADGSYKSPPNTALKIGNYAPSDEELRFFCNALSLIKNSNVEELPKFDINYLLWLNGKAHFESNKKDSNFFTGRYLTQYILYYILANFGKVDKTVILNFFDKYEGITDEFITTKITNYEEFYNTKYINMY